MKTHHLDCIFHNVADYLDVLLLSESQGPCYCLILYARIPLRLHDEDTIGGGKVQSGTGQYNALTSADLRKHLPKSTCPSGHD